MAKSNQEKDGMSLYSLKEALDRAQKMDDDQAVITALLDLGFAQILDRQVEEGVAQFDAAFERAGNIPNVELQVRCLGLKALAYQGIERFHDAFQIINDVLKIAEQNNNSGIKCDALTSQGQILLDSGEPIVAQEKLDEALKIANELGDKRRQMNVLGVLGNQSIAVASLARAEEYFDQAYRLADELGDVQAKIGNLGNRASVLAWQGNYQDAIPGFEKVLGFVHEQGDQGAEITALRNLTQAYSKLKDNEKALDHALRGVELCRKSNNDALLSFYETMIVVYYRLGKVQEAQQINQDAVNLARAQNNNAKELEFLLSLGEAQYLSELNEEALGTYQGALELAKRINRRTDEAYLIGRIGVALAELGRLDEAIQHHSQAVEFARLLLLPRLEGEQLSMLAMAHYEKGETKKAREYGSAAIQVFTEAGLTEEIQKAVQLLKKMDV